MASFSIYSIVSIAFLGYIGHSIYSLYLLYHPPNCTGDRCIQPYLKDKDSILLQLRLFASLSSSPRSGGSEIAKYDKIEVNHEWEREVIVELPQQTRLNGTIWIHVFLLPHMTYNLTNPFDAPWYQVATTQMTTYMVPEAETFKLMGSKASENASDAPDKAPPKPKESVKQSKPVSHWRSVLPLSVCNDQLAIDPSNIPGEIYRYLKVHPQKHEYYPILYINDLSFRLRELVEIKESVSKMKLTVAFSPISIGKMRLLGVAQNSIEQLKGFGFTQKDTDEVKSIFTDTNFYFLALTFFVAAVHLLLDFLAIKNDVRFWKNRKTLLGLSARTGRLQNSILMPQGLEMAFTIAGWFIISRVYVHCIGSVVAVIWNCCSHFIIFVYLFDQETSLLVLIPSGVGVLIEVWKVVKTVRMRKRLAGEASSAEQDTETFDTQGMHYLTLLLIPLCLGGAVYSLLYVPHRSWRSWVIQCLANGVYAFGFLFMLPQLFINYKLKSVAHLPWRAFMYKAFNTFIDDMFAFIIKMPTAHRLACFRDDIVFVIYLYQRWLYPCDYTRINEFGESFEPDSTSTVKQESKKHK